VPETPPASLAAYRSAARAVIPQQRMPAAALAGVLTYIGRADRAIAASDVPGAHDALVRAQQLLAVLRGSLDHAAHPHLTQRLDSLYAYAMTELGRANLDKDPQRLAALVPVVTVLREAWEGAAEAELHRTRAVAGGGGTG
jgi:flagellar secretion chaperone FliS